MSPTVSAPLFNKARAILRNGAGALALGLLFAVALAPAVGPARAETAAAEADFATRISDLSQIMHIGGVIEVMRQEGIDYGTTLEAEMFPGSGGTQWQRAVALIYDADTMHKRFDAALTEALAGNGADLPAIEAFFGSEQGQRILELEIEARRALLDEAVEDAAKLSWADLNAEGSPRIDRLQRFAQANDLIESNVMGALNANLAFYRGMAESGAFPDEMTEEQMLSDVWAQEPEVRAETQDWLFPYLSLAYQPLPDADLDAYIAFSESPEGKRMNAALFSAFDSVFGRISYDLGRAAARQMQGEDI